MADEEHLRIIRQGVNIWNEWREKHPELIPDLSGADLFMANLSRASLTGAIPMGALLIETDLRGADLTGSSIYGAAVWDIKVDDETNQQNLVITPFGEPAITVDNIEVAQFIYLLLNNS